MTLFTVAAWLAAGSLATADVVTDWNITAGDIVVAAKLPPPPAYRVMAMVQSAVYEAVNAVTKRYPSNGVKLDVAPGASVEAAVAAANRAVLSKLIPSQQPAIDSAYQATLSGIPASAGKAEGIAVGERLPPPSCHAAPTTAPARRKAIARARLQASTCPPSYRPCPIGLVVRRGS